MPRPKIEAAFVGHYTLAIIDEASERDAGWIAKALARWILHDAEPDTENLSATRKALWRIVHDESVSIHDARKQQIEAGRKGGKAKGSEREANGKQTESEPQANGYQDIEEDRDISTNRRTADSGARVREEPATADSGQRTAVDIPSRVSSAAKAPSFCDDPDRWEVWARTVHDPVDAALSATGEGPSKRPVYGKLLRDLGDKDLFREAVIMFAAERRAGDPMRNPAAVLVKKLKQEIADEAAARARLAK